MYMCTPLLPLLSQCCYALAPAKLISAVLQPRVPGLEAPCSRVTLQLNESVFHLNSVGTVEARLNAIPTPVSTAFATASLVLYEGVTTLVSFPHIPPYDLSLSAVDTDS